MRVDISSHDDIPTVALVGGVDRSDVDAFYEALTQLGNQGHDHVTLDLSGALFLDAMTLDTIVNAHGRGMRFTIANPQPSVKRVLILSGVSVLLSG